MEGQRVAVVAFAVLLAGLCVLSGLNVMKMKLKMEMKMRPGWWQSSNRNPLFVISNRRHPWNAIMAVASRSLTMVSRARRKPVPAARPRPPRMEHRAKARVSRAMATNRRRSAAAHPVVSSTPSRRYSPLSRWSRWHPSPGSHGGKWGTTRCSSRSILAKFWEKKVFKLIKILNL